MNIRVWEEFVPVSHNSGQLTAFRFIWIVDDNSKAEYERHIYRHSGFEDRIKIPESRTTKEILALRYAPAGMTYLAGDNSKGGVHLMILTPSQVYRSCLDFGGVVQQLRMLSVFYF